MHKERGSHKTRDIYLHTIRMASCVPHNQQLLIFEGLYPREGENRSFSSLDGWVFDSLIITKRTSLSERGYPTENTMAKRQKDRQYNGQKTEGQTTQWPKDRRTCRSVFWPLYCLVLLSFGHCIVCPFSFDHCIVCPSFFWPLYCLSFCLLAIVWIGRIKSKDDNNVYKTISCRKDEKLTSIFQDSEELSAQTRCIVLNTSHPTLVYGIDDCYTKHPYICLKIVKGID
jgi:hypothetical protein